MATGRITKGKKTANHGAWLATRGYKVTEDEKGFDIEVNGFVTDPIDLDQNPDALKEIVAEKKAITYGTEVTLNGKVLRSIMLCTQMQAASSLVMKDKSASKAKKAKKAVNPAFDL